VETCPNCGFEAPAGTFCARCGERLAAEGARRRGFAAAPHEHLFAPRVISTIFPHLPRAGADTFRALLLAGLALLAALSLAGLFPVALIVAAVLVPLLVLVYLREVDVYEDEPLRVVGLTALWGAGAGVAVGFLRDAVRNPDATLASQVTGHAVLWNGVLIPLIGFALVLAGPLALLPYRKFNDVLDGVTFGGSCAVVFGGAELLVHSSTFLSAGLEPAGLVTPWVLRVLTLGIAVPVLAAAAVGSATGVLWLRYRAPTRDRSRLGPAGQPAVAVPLAAGLLVGAALAQLYLSRWAALGVVVALDLAALVWLRSLIHVGLLEEAAEREAGPDATCADCGRETPVHTFCVHCGVALRALPKSLEQHLPHRRRRLLAVAAVAVAALVGLAAGVMAAVQPGSPSSPCPGTGACANPPRAPGGPAPGAGAVPELRTWTSTLGVRLTYDARRWQVDSTSGTSLQLTHANELTLRVESLLAGSTPTGQLLAVRVDSLRGRYPDLELDPDRSHQPAGVTVGSVAGIGEALAGHDIDGNPVEALVDAASSHGIDVVVTAWTTQQPHTSPAGIATPFDVLAYADTVLESLRWPFEHVAGALPQR
jgi:hypothetical protein